MNTSFKLEGIEIPVTEGVAIKIGKVETSVENYNILEGLQVAKEMPAIIGQLKDVIVGAIVDIKHTIDMVEANQEAYNNAELTEDDEIEITLDMVAALNKGKFRTANGEYTVSFKSHAEMIDESTKGTQIDVLV